MTTLAKLAYHARKNQLAIRKAIWRRFHRYDATATFVCGVQRSGTCMLLSCLDKSMEVDVLGEASRAMVDWRIKPDAEIRDIVRSSHHKAVVFKPLIDSHRAREFLDLIPGSRVIWAFRRAEDRANSAVTKFGNHNLEVLRAIFSGDMSSWQAQGLLPESIELIRSFDYTDMQPETAAALVWYVRNALFLSLADREDVLPLCYEDTVAEPGYHIHAVCRFIGIEFRNSMVSHVHAHSVGLKPSSLPEDVRILCASLYQRMRDIQLRRLRDIEITDAIPHPV